MRRYLLFTSSFLLFAASGIAAKIDTAVTYSAAMKKEIPAVVVTPDSYAADRKYPVVYLLHGYGNSYGGYGGFGFYDLADAYGMIFVSADGNFSSWYFDSPVDPAWRYEAYVAKELVEFVDQHYSTIASPGGRAITGLSMGGHGALYLAFRHRDVFGAAGSMSGGVDFRPFPNSWDIALRLGDYAKYPENWEQNTVVNLVHLLQPSSPAIIFDCGTSDFFYPVNCALHEKLLYHNIPHEFTSRPGGHTFEYWKNSIKYHLLFFNDFFRK
jgi:S-formylglutathione hydrolase FrmB